MTMNVLDTSSHGDRPMCQLWYANIKTNRSYRLDMKTWQKPIKLTWRSKVNLESGSWIYTTHHLMVIYPCAKYVKPMSNQKKLWAGHESAQTDGRTDGQTDRQISIYPMNFVRGGYNKISIDNSVQFIDYLTHIWCNCPYKLWLVVNPFGTFLFCSIH